MDYQIAVILGDGVGAEIVKEAILVLETIGKKYGHNFQCIEVLAGTAAVDCGKPPFPEESLEICKKSDGILLGKLSLGKHMNLDFFDRPESILSVLRTELKLNCDIRPAFVWDTIGNMCPLKEEIRRKGLDIVVVRDIAGGMFAAKGESGKLQDKRAAWDTESYDESVIRSSARMAFEIARSRKKKLISLDKAILLSSSVLWRQIVEETHKDFPEVELQHMLVDHAALEVISHPEAFDVILASNVFGDIVSDEIAGLTGAQELLPDASLNKQKKGLYSPNQLHQALENYAGKNMANPIGMILAAALMLDYSFGLKKEAQEIWEAVLAVLTEKKATSDFWVEGKELVSTKEMGNAIRGKIGGVR